MSASRTVSGNRGAGFGMSDLSVAIDRITCDGYGTCAELLPEMITLDDWGYPIIRPGTVPTVLLDHARMAVDTCPVLALRLVSVARATMTPAVSAPAATVWAGGRARSSSQ
jgi:ferredoxin